MIKMLKWNDAKGEYEPYDVPADWGCKLYEPKDKLRKLRQGGAFRRVLPVDGNP